MIELRTDKKENWKKPDKTGKENKLSHKWKKTVFVDKYNALINCNDKKLVTITKLLKENKNNRVAAKTHQNDLFNELNRLLKCSADQTAQSFSNKYYKRIFKSNSWYTAELIEQIKIKNTSKERADVDTKSNEVKQIKRIAYNNYRNLLRKNKQRAKHNEFIELDKLRCSDTDKFWRRIKSKLEKKVIVEADIEQLKNEYEMLFTSKIVDDSSIKADIAEAEMKGAMDNRIMK